MNPRHVLDKLTLGAVRTILIGSPVRLVATWLLLFLLIALCLYAVGCGQQWAIGTALAALVAYSTALIYFRNEHHYQQIEAIIRLTSSLESPVPLPPMRGWKLAPDAAVILVQHLKCSSARQIVEAGCGVSTVLIAAVLKQQGNGVVMALEHDAQQVAVCRQQLHLLELEAHAVVLHAPLVKHSINGTSYLWYNLEQLYEMLPSNAPIDLLLIDGPPVWTQHEARYPALPLLASKLKTRGGIILLDDAKRVSEKRVMRRWQVEFPNWIWSHESTEDGLAIGITATEADACE